MKNVILIFFILLISDCAHAADVHVLLGVDVSPSVIRNFEQRFSGSGLNLIIQPKASLEDIANAISKSNTVAVFFVGHAGSSKNFMGVSVAPVLIDYYGNDFTSILSMAHPGLQFLGLVGCNAQQALNRIRRDLPKSLVAFSFDDLVYAEDHFWGIKGTGAVTKAIDAAAQAISRGLSYEELFPYSDPCAPSEGAVPDYERERACRREKENRQIMRPRQDTSSIQETTKKIFGYSIQIKRRSKSGATLSPLLITREGRLVHLFGASASEQVADIVSSVSDRLEFHSLQGPMGRSRMVEQELIVSSVEGNWTPMTGKSGVVLGTYLNIYKK